MFIIFSSSVNWIMFCTVSWRLAIRYLCSVAMHLYGWVGGELLQKMQSDWILDFPLQGASPHAHINFMYIFPIPMQTVPVYIPSQFFDSRKKIVYLKLERAIQHCLLVFTSQICIVDWFCNARLLEFELLCSLFLLKEIYYLFYILKKKEQGRTSSFSFSFSWKQKWRNPTNRQTSAFK